MVTLTQNFASAVNLAAGTGSMGFSVQRYDMTSSGSAVPGTPVFDSEISVITDPGAWYEYVVQGDLGKTVTLQSLTPDSATIVGNRVTKVGVGGLSRVKVSAGNVATTIFCPTLSGQKTVSIFTGYAADSLSDVLASAILDRITAGKQDNYFTNYSSPMGYAPPTTYTLNPDCWAYGVDVTGCAVATTIYNQYSSANRGGLVTDQHVVGAVHWEGGTGYSVGDKFRFLGSDGVIRERTVVGVGKGFFDAVVATLDSPLPVQVSPFKIAGEWYARNSSFTTPVGGWGNSASYCGGAMFYVDQQYRCRFLLGTATYVPNIAYANFTLNGHTYEEAIARGMGFAESLLTNQTPTLLVGKTEFLKAAVSGDSGSPVMLLIDGEAVLLGTWWYPTEFTALWNDDGAILNDLIAIADADAVARENLVSPTGKTVTVAPDPTL